ncbi:HigA family addiction module antitoxin [Synechococcus sp. PCC 7336]|uniref:HigA family addiction module antitoxin n=1 Tax=Synechococcus sp. PCC 7336 TaxID=195250 RepID=UPI001D0CE9FE|nr:HigA family addiction module antitoxin [Synechococcus sp. PCC 7336]
MHNPPHPGEFIREIYLEPFDLSIRQLAKGLGVSPSTLSRVVKGQSGVTPEMALRLSKGLGRSPESWLLMQSHYDLWHARQNTDLSQIQELNFDAA